MSGERGTKPRRKAVWVPVMVLSLLGLLSTGVFLSVSAGWGAFGLVPIFGGLVGFTWATGMLRPRSYLIGVALVGGIAFAMVSQGFTHSAWLTVFGERADCVVVERHESSTRSGSDYYHHTFECGGRAVQYTGRSGYVADQGDGVLLVVDRLGVVDPALVGDVSSGRNLAFVGVVLAGLLFVLVVALLPPPRPAPRLPGPKVSQEFL
ncbi:hypothetical protein [Saccharothrix hoggarensis]|uniref:Uncharacterized protein n=1 Tax=Saccharothrix hoggarensis TaxID=913853 RepID=A0ABW3QUD1_9PSEU